MLYHATILGPPRTKKTSNRVFFIGPRCPRCNRGETPLVKPSEAFEGWEKMVAPQLREAMQTITGGAGPDVVCARCDGGEKDPRYPGDCIGCGGTGARPVPISSLLWVRASIYRDALRGDWLGYTQALADALESTGVIANDERIKSWDGTRLLKDAKRPRIEVEIFPFDEETPTHPQLALLPEV